MRQIEGIIGFFLPPLNILSKISVDDKPVLFDAVPIGQKR